MEYPNDLHHVRNTVVNHMGPLRVFSVALEDFIACTTDQQVFAYELKRFIKLSEVVVALCLAPSTLSESANAEQVLTSGPGNSESASSGPCG